MLKALIRGKTTNTFFMVVFLLPYLFSFNSSLFHFWSASSSSLLFFLVTILSFKRWDIFEERKALFCWLLSLMLQGLYVTFESALRRLFSNSSRLLFSLSLCVCLWAAVIQLKLKEKRKRRQTSKPFNVMSSGVSNRMTPNASQINALWSVHLHLILFFLRS